MLAFLLGVIVGAVLMFAALWRWATKGWSGDE